MNNEIKAENKIKLEKINEKCKLLTTQPHCDADALCEWNGIKNTCDITKDCANLNSTSCSLQIKKCIWENDSCVVNYRQTSG